MKNYFSKLNNKPRLKKCLKILGIVGICLSVLFNAVIIGTAVALKVNEQEDNYKSINTVATTPIKGSYQFLNSNYEIESGDYLITTFITNYLSTYDGKSFTYLTTNRRYLYTDLVLYLCDWQYITQNRPNNFYSIIAALDIDYVNYGDVDATGVKVFTYDFKFTGYSNSPFSSSNVNLSVTYRVNYIPRRVVINDVQYNDWLLHGQVVVDSSYALNTNIGNRYVLFSQTENSDLMYKFLTGYLTEPDQQALALEYERGRAVGYQEGLVAGNTDTNNAFTLISKAFSSVASVLNIQILPNLTLGVLIFVPIIVSVIIVVVKMIKG